MANIVSGEQRLATEFSSEDRKKLCEDWAKTGLTKSEFLRQHNLPWSFFAWCRELLPNTNRPGPKATKDDWIKVVPKNNSIDKQQNSNLLELRILCSAMVINLQIPQNQVIDFIKELSDAAAVIR